MKKKTILTSWLFILSVLSFAQKNNSFRLLLIGEYAPPFVSESTNGVIHFPSDYANKWKILFSYPADFDTVSTTEILELAALQKDFKKLGVQLLVLSTDSLQRHKKWKAMLNKAYYKGRDPTAVKFSIIDDYKQTVSKEYGLLDQNSFEAKDMRVVYFIDPENKIETVFIYPINVGRNITEIKRIIIALKNANYKGGL